MRLDTNAKEPPKGRYDSLPIESRLLAEYADKLLATMTPYEKRRLTLSWSVYRHLPEIEPVVVNANIDQAMAVITEQQLYHVSDKFELRLEVRQVLS